MPKFSHSTHAEHALPNLINNARFGLNNALERIKTAPQGTSSKALRETRGVDRDTVFLARLSDPQSPVRAEVDRLAAELAKELEGHASGETCTALAERLMTGLQRKLTDFLLANEARIHDKLCSIMDFTLSRSIANSAVDFIDERAVKLLGHPSGIRHSHGGTHELERSEIINTAMNTETFEVLILREFKTAGTKLLADAKAAATAGNAVAVDLADRPVDDAFLRSGAYDDGSSVHSRKLAVDKGTQKMAMMIADAFMTPREETVARHASVIHAASRRYQKALSEAVNDGGTAGESLRIKPGLIRIRDQLWSTVRAECGYYPGLDNQQTRLMKHMAQQYSELNYGIARGASRLSGILGAASTIGAATLAGPAGIVARNVVGFCTSTLAGTAMSTSVQMLAGDVVSNAAPLRRYQDADAMPPMFAHALKSAQFKANREIIDVCRTLIENIRKSQQQGTARHSSPAGTEQFLQRVADLSSAHHAEARVQFPSLEAAREHCRQSFATLEIARKVALTLKEQASETTSYDNATLALIAMLDKGGRIRALTNEESFASACLIDAYQRAVLDQEAPAAATGGAEELPIERATRHLIMQLTDETRRNALDAELSRSAPLNETPPLKHDVLSNPVHIARAVVDTELALCGLMTIKENAAKSLLSHGATEASLRAVMRGGMINSAVPSAVGVAAAVPGMVVGSLLAPGIGTVAIGAGTGLAGNWLAGKLGNLTAGEAVVKNEARAAIEGKLAKLIKPGEEIVPEDAIREEIKTARSPRMTENFARQVEGIVVARTDDLLDTISKDRYDAGRLMFAALYKHADDQGQRVRMLEDFVKLQALKGGIEMHQRTIQKLSRLDAGIADARQDVAALHEIREALAGETKGGKTLEKVFATNSIRKSKESKSEHIEKKLEHARSELQRILPEATRLASDLFAEMAGRVSRLSAGRPCLNLNDQANLAAPFVYPVNVLDDSDERVKDAMETLRHSLVEERSIGNTRSVLMEHLGRSTPPDKDLAALTRAVERHNKHIDKAEQDVVEIARDHWNYQTDRLDAVQDRFGIYDRAHSNYDTLQSAVRSYAEVSGTGIARVGAQLVAASTSGLAGAVAGAATTGIGTHVSDIATGAVAARAGVSAPAAKELLSGRIAEVATLTRLSTQTLGSLSRFASAPTSGLGAATRGSRLSERPGLDPNLTTEGAAFTFRPLGLNRIERRMRDEIGQAAFSALQTTLNQRGSHKVFSFERHGVRAYEHHSGVIGTPRLRGFEPNPGAAPELHARLDELAARARHSEGRGAARRTLGEVAKNMKIAPNATKFSYKALAPSDARVVASVNNLRGELTQAVLGRIAQQNLPQTRESALSLMSLLSQSTVSESLGPDTISRCSSESSAGSMLSRRLPESGELSDSGSDRHESTDL